LRIDFQRQRFVVSVSESDVLRLIYGGALTSIAVLVDGVPVEDHALTLCLEKDHVHDDTHHDPLPPAQEHLKSWLFRLVQQEVEMPEMWLDRPKLAFGSDGQLLELVHHRSGNVAMERTAPDAVIFDVDRVQVQVTAVCECGDAGLVCWAGDDTASWPAFRDLVLQGDEARRLFDSGR
jgi:hypothetical protein